MEQEYLMKHLNNSGYYGHRQKVQTSIKNKISDRVRERVTVQKWNLLADRIYHVVWNRVRLVRFPVYIAIDAAHTRATEYGD